MPVLRHRRQIGLLPVHHIPKLAVKAAKCIRRGVMMRNLLAVLALFSLLVPAAVQADPSDVTAAARGVVRVVIVGSDGSQVFPVSHGTGFAVTPTQIVTNAHVVREAQQDDTLRIAVVPPEGNNSAFAHIVAISPRNDLALIELTGDSLKLPPLTIAGKPASDGAEVSAVGYPMNVDRAQGLNLADVFRSQPPVKSRGFVSGSRPSRQFDTILHTAPIARGNSGGPLVDGCGRVLGVNSFGADAQGGDAEFYFAVSDREVLPFLRANSIDPQVNALPCRSLAEVDQSEQARIAQEQMVARQNLARRAEAVRDKRNRAQLEAEMAVTKMRENQMAMAFLLVLLATGAGVVAWQARGQKYEERQRVIAGGIAAVASVVALALWITRPGLDEIDRQVAAAMQDSETQSGAALVKQASNGAMICTLDTNRSRITGTADDQLQFDWAADGCVNGRTQYGFNAGTWSRVFVPNTASTVSVNIYDPDSKTFRTDRYLLDQDGMDAARTARSAYEPPACASENAASKLGDLQGAVISALPASPNERLVYSCSAKNLSAAP